MIVLKIVAYKGQAEISKCGMHKRNVNLNVLTIVTLMISMIAEAITKQ